MARNRNQQGNNNTNNNTNYNNNQDRNQNRNQDRNQNQNQNFQNPRYNQGNNNGQGDYPRQGRGPRPGGNNPHFQQKQNQNQNQRGQNPNFQQNQNQNQRAQNLNGQQNQNRWAQNEPTVPRRDSDGDLIMACSCEPGQAAVTRCYCSSFNAIHDKVAELEQANRDARVALYLYKSVADHTLSPHDHAYLEHLLSENEKAQASEALRQSVIPGLIEGDFEYRQRIGALTHDVSELMRRVNQYQGTRQAVGQQAVSQSSVDNDVEMS